jgi:hypothetical protein
MVTKCILNLLQYFLLLSCYLVQAADSVHSITKTFLIECQENQICKGNGDKSRLTKDCRWRISSPLPSELSSRTIERYSRAL